MTQNDYKRISITDFDYDLPTQNIAQQPPAIRGSSKLLVHRFGETTHANFFDISNFIPSNARLVFNDTKVIAARIFAHRETGAKIELFLLSPISPFTDMEQALLVRNEPVVWQGMIGNARKWKVGERLVLEVGFVVQFKRLDAINNHIEILWDGNQSFAEVLQAIGKMPLPPYIKREANTADDSSYQTVYAKHDGAVAAPTAGLHFTNDILASLKEKGVAQTRLTLHVGAGTFKPVDEDFVWNHPMHQEYLRVEVKALEELLQSDHLVATGTTSLRTLESLFWMGYKIHYNLPNPFEVEQHLPYLEDGNLSADFTFKEAVQTLLKTCAETKKTQVEGRSGLMIMPGYTIRSTKQLITNFHLPKSTLLLLVSACVGEGWKAMYKEALDENYQFLSYGDSSILSVCE